MLEVIKKRRSSRRFQIRQISNTDLEKIIEAGQYAPSGGNSQFCHIVVIQNKCVLNKIKQLVVEAFSKMELKDDMYKSLRNSIKKAKAQDYNFLYNAPTLIIICNKYDYPNAIADSAIMIENMMLEATALDLGSCYINQLHWLDKDLAIRDYLKEFGVPYSDYICGSVALGYKEPGELPKLDRTGNTITYIR